MYRPGTSDERVLQEVTIGAIYRRSKPFHFDVEPGEHWLDLGANIGAFALYCKLRGATAECYEPDPECFEILRANVPDFECYNAVVTVSREPSMPFWKGKSETDFYRGTCYPTKGLPRHPNGEVINYSGEFLKAKTYDGVKMDIEGSEGPLLDAGYFPTCKKFCMEYHLSRDPSMENLRRRLDFLKSRFRLVHYPPEFERLMAQGGNAKTFFDRMVYCIV